MIKFLTKGLLRDRSRSLFPVLVITLTVSMVVFTIGFMRGTMNSLFLDTAVILTGHEKIVTRAYNEESQLILIFSGHHGSLSRGFWMSQMKMVKQKLKAQLLLLVLISFPMDLDR
jgi:hypothetical protein